MPRAFAFTCNVHSCNINYNLIEVMIICIFMLYCLHFQIKFDIISTHTWFIRSSSEINYECEIISVRWQSQWYDMPGIFKSLKCFIAKLLDFEQESLEKSNAERSNSWFKEKRTNIMSMRHWIQRIDFRFSCGCSNSVNRNYASTQTTRKVTTETEQATTHITSFVAVRSKWMQFPRPHANSICFAHYRHKYKFW